MHSRSNKLKKLLGFGAKLLLAGILLIAIFSPIQVFTHKALAAPIGCPTGYFANNSGSCTASDKNNPIPFVDANGKSVGRNIADPCAVGYFATINGNCSAIDPNNPEQQQTANGAPVNSVSTALAEMISNVVYIFTVGLMSSIAYICGYFFNLAVHMSLQGPIYALTFISEGWTWARDIANMAFILIILYLAFIIMLQAELANTFKTLAGVVVVALLVNFSFFITRVVVDAGNILAIQIYNAIPGVAITKPPQSAGSTVAGAVNAVGAAETAAGVNNVSQTKDLTAAIMGAIKIQDILSTKSFQQFAKDNSSFGGFFTQTITLSLIYIAIGIMFALLAGSFLFAGIKFIMRVVGLWFVIISAPLAFVAAALEKGGESKTKLFARWQSKLLQYSFYPAIYLFMFLILSRFMTSLSVSCSSIASSGAGCLIGDIFADITNGQVAQAGFIVTIAAVLANVFIRLGLVVALMYIALSVSDIIVTDGSDKARGFQKTVLSGLTGGFVGGLGRATLGNAGRVGQKLGIAPGVSSYLANRSYDLRNVPGVGNALRVATGGFAPLTADLRKGLGLNTLPVDFGKGPRTVPKKKDKDDSKNSNTARNTTATTTTAPVPTTVPAAPPRPAAAVAGAAPAAIPPVSPTPSTDFKTVAGGENFDELINAQRQVVNEMKEFRNTVTELREFPEPKNNAERAATDALVLNNSAMVSKVIDTLNTEAAEAAPIINLPPASATPIATTVNVVVPPPKEMAGASLPSREPRQTTPPANPPVSLTLKPIIDTLHVSAKKVTVTGETKETPPEPAPPKKAPDDDASIQAEAA